MRREPQTVPYNNGEQTGRTLSGTVLTLGFDYDGQLTSITNAGSVTSFGFDAIGRRVTRAVGGTTTRFYYDGERDLVEKQGSTTTGTYTYGEDLIRKGSETLLYDGQGNLRCSTNAFQTVVDTANPDAFGKTIGSTGSTASPFQFGATSGYQNWGDVGLYHVGARSYDPQVGPFIIRDTNLNQYPSVSHCLNLSSANIRLIKVQKKIISA